jgi:hypothetical protein
MTAQSLTKIGNAREYQITRDTIHKLERGIAEQETFRAGRDPAEHWLSVAGMEGMLADLCQQAAEYSPADGLAYEATLSAIRRFELYERQLDEASDRLDMALLGLLRKNTQDFLDDLRAQAIEYAAAKRRNA